MSLEVVGKLIKKLEHQNGVSKAGKEWHKDGFVLQLPGNYPSELQIDIFNKPEMSMFINDTSLETVLKCNINIESREYNGRYFHNVTLWKAEVMREEGNTVVEPPEVSQPPEPEGDDTDLPFDCGESDAPKTKDMLLTPSDTFEIFTKNKQFSSLVEKFNLEIV